MTPPPLPLRVTVVGLHYAPEHSGNAPYTTGLARHLAAVGMDTSAVTGYPHYPEWRLHPDYRSRRPVEVDRGVVVRRHRHHVPASPSGATRVLMESQFALGVAGDLLRRRSDVVVAVSPVLLSLIPAVLFRRARGYALGVLVQDLYGAALAETGLGGGLLTRATAWLEGQLLRRADGVVVIHEVFRRRLVEAGVQPDRIRVIPNWTHVDTPVDVDRAAVRARLGWGPDEVIALHAGNMGVKQGLEGLVALARAADEHGSRVRVVLLGDGSQREHLRGLARGIRGITFTDPLPAGAFEEALAAADVLLLHEKPGVVEMSVPSKLTSYFAAGRPVVAATHPDSGAAAQMAAAGAGPTVLAGDARALLAAVEDCAVTPVRAAEQGASARAYARDHLAAASSLAAYEQWIHDLAAGAHDDG